MRYNFISICNLDEWISMDQHFAVKQYTTPLRLSKLKILITRAEHL